MDLTPSARSISFAYEPDSVKGISKGLLFQPLPAKQTKITCIDKHVHTLLLHLECKHLGCKLLRHNSFAFTYAGIGTSLRFAMLVMCEGYMGKGSMMCGAWHLCVRH